MVSIYSQKDNKAYKTKCKCIPPKSCYSNEKVNVPQITNLEHGGISYKGVRK